MSTSAQNALPNATFHLANSILMRLLGVIHLLAFGALWQQAIRADRQQRYPASYHGYNITLAVWLGPCC